ncbi:MAG: MtaA/CmuA family methyltransferase [Desulfobacterales bacterium]|jgi:[methyl-Co(III) methanol-specific corrinoid protein]:coenzyme M methyltransferase
MKSSSYNLVMSALFNGRKGDRPPVGNPTSVVCHGLMEEAGVSFPDAHIDANAMADLALAGHEILGFDTVMPEYSVQQEAAALGCTMDWGDRDRMPDNKDFPNADFSDVQVPENILEKPSMKVVLDALSILRKHVGGKVAIIGKVMGPWTLSYHMAGTQNFLLQIGMGETESIKKMLRQLMPVTVAFARAQFEAGADIVVLADHATGNLVGPYHYEELLLPIHQEITNQIEGPLILHVCGDCSDRLELFAASGVDAYHFEWQVDARTAVDKVGHLISLVGNINNPKTLYQGTPDDVYQQVRYSIAAGVNIIGPECAIPLATPIENLKAIVEAAREGYE